MLIADTRTFNVGPYTISQRPRTDNPAWPVYIITKGSRYIGRSFSIPDEGCCQWLEATGGVYATESYTPARPELRGAVLERIRKLAST